MSLADRLHGDLAQLCLPPCSSTYLPYPRWAVYRLERTSARVLRGRLDRFSPSPSLYNRSYSVSATGEASEELCFSERDFPETFLRCSTVQKDPANSDRSSLRHSTRCITGFVIASSLTIQEK